MNIQTMDRGGIIIVKLPERLDALTSEDIRKELESISKPGVKMIIDMEQTQFVSSMGMRILMLVSKYLEQEGGTAVLSRIKSHIREIMEVTGYWDVLNTVEDMDAALDYFSE